MLRDPRAGGGGDERRGGRDVEGVRAVAARADDVHHVPVVLERDHRREFAHHLGGGGDFADRLLLHPQADDEASDLRRREFPAHDLPHHVQHLVVENLAVFHGALDRLCDSDLHDVLPFMTFSYPESFSTWHGRVP